jgi:hypothetical protein
MGTSAALCQQTLIIASYNWRDFDMNDFEQTNDSAANILCKSCGLCCTGHLFIWAKLRPSELDPAEELGMHVYRSDPNQRGFAQPCPVWRGHCTIYASPNYPHVCRAYKCKLLKEVIAESRSLSDSLPVIERAKGMIRELEAMLPPSTSDNFRERLVACLENPLERQNVDEHFLLKAEALLHFYKDVFGVDDLVETDS